MTILGIETSCDETAAAVLQESNNRIQILSNIVASSFKLQEKFGGIIPEQAAREQIKTIIPVISEAINDSRLTINEIDAIAVTEGPGLIGSLLVGVETAKTLSLVWDKPLIPVNHLLGHFWANWITFSVIPAKAGIYNKVSSSAYNKVSSSAYNKVSSSAYKNGSPIRSGMTKEETPTFPCIGLLVSGGHTDLVLFTDHGRYKYLGGTRDDAAGECFDKCARLLGLPYPGGPEISKLAKNGDPNKYKLPRPMIDSKNFDFSFSGLKTAVANLVSLEGAKSRATKNVVQQTVQNFGSLQTPSERNERASGFLSRDERLHDLCASIEQAIVDVLVSKVLKAAQEYKVEQLMVAGGVASNQKLKNSIRAKFAGKVFIPPPFLCTDNASMIASRAFFETSLKNPLYLQANPNLSLEN